MSTPEPTKRAAAFMVANRSSPVTDGRITSTGMRYVLQNGSEFKLDDRDLATLPDASVKWLHSPKTVPRRPHRV